MQNATSHGLFAKRDFVRPCETAQYDELTASLLDDLRPEGALERTMVFEIVSAARRLRRCSELEAALAGRGEYALDPMEDPTTLPMQNTVDRVRGQG